MKKMEMKNEVSFWIKGIFFFFLFSTSISGIFALNAQVYINETSSVTKLLNGQYSLIADGTIEIYNPSNVSKIYEFNIPLDLDALIGINRVDLGNSSSSKFNFNYERAKGYMIEPNETVKTGYHIYGLLTYNIYNTINSQNSTVFSYYAKSIDLSSNVVITLDKPQREGYEYNLSMQINSTPTTNTTRLISASLQNPTDYDYTIRKMNLYRTAVSDPFFKSGNLIKTFSNLTVNPFDKKKVDFFDTNSDDASVYWVSNDVVINYNLTFDKVTSYSVQSPSNSKPSSSGGGSYGINSSTGSPSGVVNSILLKKGVDKTLIRSGEEFKVYLRIVNVNDFTISNLHLYDEIPAGYEIKDVSDSMKLENGKLTFKIDSVEAYGTKVIVYTLVSRDEFKGITYLKPANLVFGSESIFSEGVLVINDLLPDKKIFVQKEVKYVDDTYAQVTIRVKNLGGTALEDILVSDFIDENSVVKEISQVFYERGVWKIKRLGASEEWEVTYMVERNNNLDKLPNVFGVDKSSIYGTLISSEEVVTMFNEEPRVIEKVGMGLAVGLLIVYLLF